MCGQVNTRFGVVMSRHGGALTKLLPLFSLGGGGVLGSGEQWFPWVSRRDVAGAILHALKTESLQVGAGKREKETERCVCVCLCVCTSRVRSMWWGHRV